MKLHVTVAGWLLGPHSGANRRLERLLAHLGPQLAEGERITVLHRPDFAPLPLPGIAWYAVSIPAGPTVRRALAERLVLPRLLRTLAVDVHDHGFLPLPHLPVPTVLLLHDLRAVDGFSRWPRPLARSVLRRSLRRAGTVVTPSAWTAARLRAFAPEGPAAVVIPNAIEAPVDAAPPPPADMPPNGFVLHVGHLEPRKNLGVAIDALALVPPGRRPELWLAGHDAGEGRRLVARAATRGVASSLRWLGAVHDARLGSLYHHARAVLLPSRHEGFGLPLLEAFAHGTPVLAADAAALPEVAGGLATLLPPDDATAWAEAMLRADALDLSARRIRAAHATRRTWSDAAASLLGVWRGLAATRRNRD